MNSNEELAILVKARGYVRSRVTRLLNASSADITAQQRTAKVEKLTSLKCELDISNKTCFPLYMKVYSDETIIDGLVEEEQVYDDKIVECISELKSMGSPGSSALGGTISEDSTNRVSQQKLKLPSVPLPEFNNSKGADVQKFIRSFEFIINKHTLSSYEKFIFLRNQLSGSPRTLIDSIDVHQQSYEVARDLLLEAFDNKLNAKYSALKSLSDLKLSTNTDPYSFIGEMRTVLANFQSLQISVEDVQQFYVWNALNSKFQSHLTNITNNSMPTLQEITENIFEATNRYNKEMKLPEKRENVPLMFLPIGLEIIPSVQP